MQDSACGIALNLRKCFFAERSVVGETLNSRAFGQSGYRTLTSRALTLVANVGSIGPTYQPGHAHADELHFELYHHGQPVVTDVGVSTYEKNERRLRSGQRQATTASPGRQFERCMVRLPCWSAGESQALERHRIECCGGA